MYKKGPFASLDLSICPKSRYEFFCYVTLSASASLFFDVLFEVCLLCYERDLEITATDFWSSIVVRICFSMMLDHYCSLGLAGIGLLLWSNTIHFYFSNISGRNLDWWWWWGYLFQPSFPCYLFTSSIFLLFYRQWEFHSSSSSPKSIVKLFTFIHPNTK